MNELPTVLDLLFPPKCPFCRRLLERPRAPLCPSCRGRLPWLEGSRGERRVDFTQGCFSPLAYRDGVPEAVRRLKFSGLRAYAVPFGKLMARCLQDHLREAPDAVTWAPLHPKRLRERGYDQAELLARAVGAELSVPCLSTLRKVRHTHPQSDLGEESARRANALGAYVLCPGAQVEGKTLVLIDDVVTSGATLGECARLLCQAGAGQVYCLTLAQARRGAGEESS